MPERRWVVESVARIAAEFNRSADTHLIRLPLAGLPGIDLYLKDESTHPTGSLKHRLARSLFLYGLVNGLIHEGTTIVEASSGSTAISEAYFARLLGLPFIAVLPDTTVERKIAEIEFLGGRCVRVPGPRIYAEAAALAQRHGGHYMDQFTNAERVTDWRGNNNIAESLFAQMAAGAAIPCRKLGGGQCRHRRHLLDASDAISATGRARSPEHTASAIVDPENLGVLRLRVRQRRRAACEIAARLAHRGNRPPTRRSRRSSRRSSTA